MKATTRSLPPQGQTRGSTSKTRWIKSAHRRRSACFRAGLRVGSSSCPERVPDTDDKAQAVEILTLIAKRREECSAGVLTKEPLGLCLEH